MFESIADYQKRHFLQNESNKGKFIKSGLWSISRHPNYFGEIGIYEGVINIERSFTLTHSAPSFDVLTLFPKENLSASGRSFSQGRGPVNVYFDPLQSVRKYYCSKLDQSDHFEVNQNISPLTKHRNLSCQFNYFLSSMAWFIHFCL